MLVRPDGDGFLAIGQASHAWVSGQLARAWAPPPAPFEAVCLAAEQHDVGMTDWDLRPGLLDGRPMSFMEMPLPEHLRLWSAAPDRLLSQSRYAALLVSMHGVALYELRNLDSMSPGDAGAVRDYLGRERARQERLIALLGADPAEARRNQELLFAWDGMSLALCLGWDAYEAAGVRLTPGPERWTADPWPFGPESLTVRCEGRRLAGRFATEEELHRALAEAPSVELAYELAPA